MKTALSVLVLSLLTVPPLAAQAPRPTPLLTLEGGRVDVAMAGDGQRIYYQVDSAPLHVYDRRTRQHRQVLDIGGRVHGFSLSPDGRMLLFEAPGEDGVRHYMTTLALDPATGGPVGSPRRVSMTWGEDPAFSSDGRFIAFAARSKTPEEQLVIVPVSGGPERVLLQTGGAFSIWPIVWSPDGQSIMYGASETPWTPQLRNAIYRIPVAGGTPQRILPTADWGGYPGLSADGRVIAAWTTGWDSIVVATSSGRRIGTYSPERGEDPEGWISGTRAWSRGTETRTAITIHPLDGGPPRIISDTGTHYLEPRWSPDGRRVAAAMQRQTGIKVFDENGQGTRVATRHLVGQRDAIFWSPDGRMLAYRTPGRPGTILSMVDIGTGAERQLATGVTETIPLRWTAGGRALIYGVLDSVMASDSTRRLTLHEVTTAGVSRVLRTTRAWCAPLVDTCLKYLNDSTVVLKGANLQYVVTDLRGRNPDRVIMRHGSRSLQPVPTVSANGRWVASRRLDASGRQHVIELVAADGSARRALNLPFRTAGGHPNPWISDDGKELIVGSQVTNTSEVVYYRVDVESGRPTRLFSTPRGFGLASLSPDRRSLATAVPLISRTTIYELDFSEMLRAAGVDPQE